MHPKYLYFIISFLLIIGSSVSAIGITPLEQQSKGDILYVGGYGPGNYTKIQYAIDNSTDGDTVYVYNDSSPYFENIIIDKQINLIGEERFTTIIDGSDQKYVIDITSEHVNISRLTILNSDIGITYSASNIHINHTKIIDTQNGTISGDERFTNIIINNNFIKENGGGIHVGSQSIITRNLFWNNTGIDISIKDATFVSITNNTFIGHKKYGQKRIDIQLDNSSDNLVAGNYIINRFDTGILLLQNSNNNNISDNYIESSQFSGIKIQFSNENILYSNNISNCKRAGIELSMGRNNLILNNDLIDNAIGVYLTFFSINNKIIQNNFYNNDRNGFFVLSSINKWDENYWGHPQRLPYPIFGIIGIRLDWHPADNPH
jgi:parallel beta-helix repeat protein